jgi:hypothetical protein
MLSSMVSRGWRRIHAPVKKQAGLRTSETPACAVVVEATLADKRGYGLTGKS